MRIVFMGTPEYSAVTLNAMITAGYDIAGVFAQPDKPVGRKRVLTQPPVKIVASAAGIPVFQPETLRDGSALKILEQLSPDIITVVAYGKIIPPEILSLPKYGCINAHASLLPKYRGASPIQWCIVCGETTTGITIQQMDSGIDTGDILSVEKVKINDGETAGELFERLAPVSAALMLKTLDSIEKGTIIPVRQDENLASHAPILTKEMAHLDFSKSAKELECAIRGFNPWPAAFFFVNEKRIKVIKAVIGLRTALLPGTIVVSHNGLSVVCGDGFMLDMHIIQPDGCKKMTSIEWLHGHNIPEGTMAK